MRYQPMLKLAILGLTVFFLSAAATWTTKPILTLVNDIAVEFIPGGPPQPGTALRVTIRATAIPEPVIPGVKIFEVKYSATGRIQLLEAPEIRDSLNPGESMEWTISVVCESNDIASVKVYFTRDSTLVGIGTRYWFVSDDTSVTVTKRTPPMPKPKPDPYAGIKSQFQEEFRADSAWYQQLQGGWDLYPLAQRPPVEGDTFSWSPTCCDPLPVPPLPNVPILTRAEFYARQIPATTADAFEIFWVEGGHWARQAGESTFSSLFPRHHDGRWHGDPQGLWPVSPSPASYSYSMVFYVPLEQAPAPLQEAVHNTTYLGQWWKFSLYRGITTLDQLPSLRAYGIGFWFDACYPPIEDASVRRQLEEGGYLLDSSTVLQPRDPAGSPPEGSLPRTCAPTLALGKDSELGFVHRNWHV